MRVSLSCSHALGSLKWFGVPWISGSPFSNPGAGQGCWPRLLPAPKDTGFSTGLTWGSLENPRAGELAPCSPHQRPCRRLFRKVLAVPGVACPERGQGQRDPGKGQEREAASRSQAGDSQEAEGICPRDRLAVPHQEAAVPSGLGQQLLRHHPADVPVVPACCCHPPKQWDTGCAVSPSQPHIGAQQ